jgi:hypothetical protein
VTKFYNPIMNELRSVGIRENVTLSVANYVLAMGGVEISRVDVLWQVPARSGGPWSAWS